MEMKRSSMKFADAMKKKVKRMKRDLILISRIKAAGFGCNERPQPNDNHLKFVKVPIFFNSLSFFALSLSCF